MLKITVFALGIFAVIFGLLLIFFPSLYINYSNSHPLIVPFIRIIGVSIFMVQGIGLLNISFKTRKKYNYLLFILTIGIFQSLTLFFSIITGEHSTADIHNSLSIILWFLSIYSIILIILLIIYRKNLY